MALQLPPLTAIRAFEAAARHGSFTEAAAELGMTQAAVSYQIKVLEDRVGAPLFLRRPRQITLTEIGRQLAPAVSEAFELLSGAYQTAKHGAQGTLVINSVQTFAAHWLALHMGSFQMAHPALAVRLQTSTGLVDFARDDVDLVIRAGGGNWPGLTSHLLMKAEFTPMLSPGLAASIGGVRVPSDLTRLPLIDPADPWWPKWLEEAGVSTELLEKGPRSELGAQTFAASAAMAGRGVALLTPAFYRAELANGRLVQPFDLVCDDGHGYWLAYPEARRNSPKIRVFRDWILSAVRDWLGAAI
ncbi:MAG TPA: LysR substrate-binding domain-containing protein [Rhizobiaceae bacterium]|nr:LysR substrate-binding domain-containing protein [Rhizobiaceae bacterium]